MILMPASLAFLVLIIGLGMTGDAERLSSVSESNCGSGRCPATVEETLTGNGGIDEFGDGDGYSFDGQDQDGDGSSGMGGSLWTQFKNVLLLALSNGQGGRSDTDGESEGNAREIRAAPEEDITTISPDLTTNATNDTSADGKKKEGIALGDIFLIFTVICTILYIVGMIIKLLKIHRGTYVQEEPVFLKYK